MHIFPAIDHLKATLDQHRPVNPAIVANLREDMIVRWPYHSNGIEDNTLTLRQTKVALEGIGDIVKDSFQPYWHALGIQPPEAHPS